MADVDPTETNPDLKSALAKSGVQEDGPADQEQDKIFKVVGDSKIAVSKHLGRIWESRIKQGQQAKADVETCWSEAIRYYEHDQLFHRNANGEGRSGNNRFARKIGNNWTETENVVFSNVTSMLPMLYAKNPSVEITPINNEQNEKFAKTCQHLVNAILGMKASPGVNMKSKARRGVLWALLTNAAYIRVNYTKKEESSEQAIKELEELSARYADPNLSKDEIKCLEGELMALEDKVSIVSPAGPELKLVSPFRLVIDPTSTEPDHSDAQWIAEYDYLQTDYLNAVYGKEKGEDGHTQVVSIYEPTHVLKADKEAGEGVQDDVNNFSLFSKDKDQEAKNYGYQSTAQFKKACYTKVWWVWDKTTRRLFLFVDGKWKWPLWVWDDPLQLIEFFPYQHLWFHETVEGSQPKGEVTYYLDQQDAINDINSDLARARTWARNNVFYDKNKISQAAVEDVLRGPDGTARGIDVPEGMKLSDAIFSFVPPNMQHPEVFQNQLEAKFATINRITGINDAQRGAQFKTNTTNDAVDFYQKNVEIRTDEKVDAIEDWIAGIAWKILQLCSRYMTVEDVANIIGQQEAQAWTQITDPNDLRTRLNLTIVGGSTEKPTSRNKKQAAVQIGQVLGQFAGGIPAIGMMVLKIFQRAFQDDINITAQDWAMLEQSMQQNMQKAGGGPSDQGGLPNDPQQLEQLVKSLPPEAQQQLQQLVQSGKPPQEALQQVMAGHSPPSANHQPTK